MVEAPCSYRVFGVIRQQLPAGWGTHGATITTTVCAAVPADGGGGGAAPLSEDASRLAQQLQAVQAELRELRTSVGSQQDEVRASKSSLFTG